MTTLHANSRSRGAIAQTLSGDAVDYIDRHYRSPISLRHVAEALGYSRAHLTHVFRLTMGTPITDWIIKKRITAATELFRKNLGDVATTSEAVGFNDISYFTRQFRRHVGMTPGRYRTLAVLARQACLGLICIALAGAPAVAATADGQFMAEMTGAMNKMMSAMEIRASGNTDADFVASMTPHHQGAIDMAQSELHYGRNARLQRIAQEIIVTQQEEITAMRLAAAQPLPPSVPAPDQIQRQEGIK